MRRLIGSMLSSSSSSEESWGESGEVAGRGTLSLIDEEAGALPLSFAGDSGSGVDAMYTVARTPFQSQINSLSVSSRNSVIRGSARRTTAIEAGVTSWLPTTQLR